MGNDPGVHTELHGKVGAAGLLAEEYGLVRECRSATAVFLGDRHAEQTEFARATVERTVGLTGRRELLVAWRNLFGEELAGERSEVGEFGCQIVCHRGLPSWCWSGARSALIERVDLVGILFGDR
ncbi:Uncharacterised protein [Mycobacteroides abscessus subsp. abscessus]|nr:Uncharacterised protein [Mycobacteroides abscessus subsp. abscessus]